MTTEQIKGDFICENCLSYVEDPVVVVFHTRDAGVDKIMPCPYCGEETLVDAEPCPSCHGWMKKGDECCDKCKKWGEGQLGLFVRSLTISVLRHLDSVIEGNSLEEFR